MLPKQDYPVLMSGVEYYYTDAEGIEVVLIKGKTIAILGTCTKNLVATTWLFTSNSTSKRRKQRQYDRAQEKSAFWGITIASRSS